MTQLRRTAGLFLVSVLASAAPFHGAHGALSGSRGAAFDAARPGTPAPAAQSRALPSRLNDAAFWKMFETLSEDGGSFPSNNFVSNETEFQTVIPRLSATVKPGGVYVGVGPDQNFSYIAQVRPDLAIMLDVRRDNLLLHLLFKALFSLAPTRLEYLGMLTGRAPPPLDTARTMAAEALVRAIDAAPALDRTALAALDRRIDDAIARTGLRVSADDVETIRRFHREFVEAGLDLVFQAFGQPRQYYYPTLRDLLLETDGAGRQRSYLASHDAYAFVRSLQTSDRIVPVVGDVAGPKAMRGLAAEMAARRLTLSAFYISNVEQYLFRDGSFGAFADNLARLPRSESAQMIRSVFPSGYRGRLPQSAPGHYSTSLTQPVVVMLGDVAAGRYRTYADLVVASAR
jgi:hypothetical protein